MRSQEIAAGFLRGVGLLLIILGLVHSAATPHIPPLLGDSSSEVYQRAVGPTLLILVTVISLLTIVATWLVRRGGRNSSMEEV